MVKKRFWNLIKYYLSWLLLGLLTGLVAQNRGNDLSFQGWDNLSPLTPISSARGNAMTAVGGTPEALFFNPAGLAAIERLSLSLGGTYSTWQWSENQTYYPNRLFFTLPFYLEGLYVPDPANNGKHDYDVFYSGLPDTAYKVSLPDTGLEPYSDKAADWIKRHKSLKPNYFSLVYPFKIAQKSAALSLAFSNSDFLDYDRNDTYLEPHIGYIEYQMPQIVNGLDTIRMDWSRFIRQRTGKVKTLRLGAGLAFNAHFRAGLGMDLITGSSSDRQTLQRVGYFLLFDQNDFAFSYDTLDHIIEGKSRFSAVKMDLGAQLAYDNFGAGIAVKFPYQIHKTSDYDVTLRVPNATNSTLSKRDESLKIPLCWTIGIYLRPVKDLTFSLDYSSNPFSHNKTQIDSTVVQRPWADQKILSWGIEYYLSKWTALRMGYRVVPQVFIPDGATDREYGPQATIWSSGLGLRLGRLGIVNLSYEMSTLKYYDQYFSNVNYSKIITHRVAMNYTFLF